MPPKGRGRGRGGPPRPEQQQPQQGRPGGQQQNVPAQGRGGPPRQEQQGRPGGQTQHQTAPPQNQYEGSQLQPSPHGQEAMQKKSKPKERTVEPEELGFKTKSPLKLKAPAKPPPGKLGRPIKLIANCFPLQAPSGNVYHYDVEILRKRRPGTQKDSKPKKDQTPDEGAEESLPAPRIPPKRNREIVNVMLTVNDNFRGRFAVYDGMRNLYSRTPLNIQTSLKCEVVLPDEWGSDPENPRMDTFEVTIKPVQKKESNDCAISLDPLHALFAGRVSSVPQEAVMALETILKHGPSMRYNVVGRQFYYPPSEQDIHPLGGGKEIWFGYHQSMRLGQWKPIVNLDISSTAFYESGDLLNFIANFLGMSLQQLKSVSFLRDNDIKKVEKEIKTLRIKVTHLKYERKYRIVKLSRQNANQLTFDVDNTQMSITAYFLQKYNVRLQCPQLPCLQVNPEKKNIFLPLEVCKLIEGQHSKKKLNDRQTAEMIKFAKKSPRERMNELREISQKRSNFAQDRFLQEFGIQVGTRPLALEGRILDAPTLRYDHNDIARPRDGSWEIRGKQYFRGAEIKQWALLSFADPRFCPSNQLDKFAKLLCNIASDQGINIGRPVTIETRNRRQVPAGRVLRDLQKQFGIDFAVVVIPKVNKDLYPEIKQEAETVLGLVTQCVLDDNVVKKCNPQLVSNLCQKINAKMGGVNNALVLGEVPAILRKPVIIIGADVSHPSPSGDIKASVAAAVGSLDCYPSRYAVTIRTQTNIDEKRKSVEIIKDLQGMVKSLLIEFFKHTRKKPENIIFYRDGVSEGQFDHVMKHELQCIRDACVELEKDYSPGITFIVVQKRHHVRFVPENERDGSGKMRNIPPGTTVDNTVVHPLNFDFFLCSHYGLQGTSRPAHYTVLHDDNDFSSDDMHKLTYYLCHTYARCTKSISCPVPVQYAHLAAYRARQHLLSVEDDTTSVASGSTGYHSLPESVQKAVEVVPHLKSTMYFV